MQQSMAIPERQISDSDESRRTIIIVVAVVAAIGIAALFYLLMRASGGGTVEPSLQGAIRAGSPEFGQYVPAKIILDKPQAYESKRALGDIVMNLETIVHNFSGRTLTGLEIKGIVVDHQGKPVNQRTRVVIPTGQTELENNRSMAVRVMLEGMTDKDDRANIQMEVTAFKFK